MQWLLEEDKDKWMGSTLILKVLKFFLKSALFDFTHPKMCVTQSSLFKFGMSFFSDFGSALMSAAQKSAALELIGNGPIHPADRVVHEFTYPYLDICSLQGLLIKLLVSFAEENVLACNNRPY